MPASLKEFRISWWEAESVLILICGKNSLVKPP